MESCSIARVVRSAVFLAALVSVSQAARGQIQVFPVDIKGTVVGVTPQAITIRTERGDLIAEIDPVRKLADGRQLGGVDAPQVKVHGEENADFLAAGMYVRFQAEVEYKRRVPDEVAQFTVIGRTPDVVFGFIREKVGDAPADDVDAAGRRANSVPKLENFTIAGQIKSVRRTSMVVMVPDEGKVKELTVRWAKEAVVKLAVDDLRLIRVGDNVTAQGVYIELPKFFATMVDVTRVADPEANAKPPAVAKGDEPNPDPFNPDKPKPDEGAEKNIVPGIILKIN